MSYPSLFCKRSGSACNAFLGCAEPSPAPFNEIRIINGDGDWYLSYYCDPTLSTFLPQQSSLTPLTGTEMADLWPWLVLMLLCAFCMRQVLKVFEL